MKFLRRLIAVVTAIIVTPVAFGLLWFGTGELSENRLAGVLITVAGMALLLVVVQTGHVSSGGLTLASIVVTAFGIAGLLSNAFVSDVAGMLKPFSHEIARGVQPWLAFGFVLVLGLSLAAASIASWTARRPTEVAAASGVRGFISVLLALAGVIVGLGFITRTDLLFVVGGGIVLALAVLVGMVSSAGLYVAGALAFLVGIVSFISTAIALDIADSDVVGGNGMEAGAKSALELGFVATFGAFLLATGTVVRAARARAVKNAKKAEREDEEKPEEPEEAAPAATV